MSEVLTAPGLTVHGAPEGFDALLLTRRRAETAAPVLHVCRDDARTARLAEALGFFASGVEVLRFPAWDCLPYDRVSPNPELVAERVATLTRLLEPSDRPRILLTTVNALVQKVPPRAAFAGATMVLKKGGRVRPEALTAFLESNGYGRTGTVMEPGEYAVRGGIIDLFPAGEQDPVRLDLFGDEIESLRRFDTGTQRSGEALQELWLRPVGEVFLDAESIGRFRAAYVDLFGAAATEDPLYVSVSAGRKHPGMEHWAGLFHAEMETLLDYVPGASVSLDHQAEDVLAARLEMIADHYEARRHPVRAEGEVPYRPAPPGRLYLTRPGWDRMLSGGPLFRFSPFARADGAEGIDAGGRPGRLFTEARAAGQNVFTAYAEHAAAMVESGRRPVLAAWTRGSRERLANLLRENRVVAQAVESFAELAKLPSGVVGLAVVGLERGFLAPKEATGAGFGLSVVGEQDLLGERIARPPRRRKRADQFIADATGIEQGDLVVHADHGIGRYDGLETIEVNGAPHDCLRLIYDGGDKLFLPVENIEVLSRFGTETAGVALDKLGGTSWQNRKAKAKQRIQDMAGQLIRIAAERQLREGQAAMPPEGAFDEFCARFPFAETEDQQRAISDVLEDLASGRPMDRLICGDVGFGKTEVALRAAFVVAMAGLQVAVVVPTTLLARQHFRTFRARFEGLPVNVAQLSRLVTAKEAAQVKEGLKDGSINIVVGTHALLGKGVEFAELGLVIVDEEQHFGVAHKEKLKALKTDVHVLTLTATPIPRTLQLALTGVREMSVIATPPVDRLAVRTFIMPWDGVVLREAIQRERFRGGQIFCVVPRLEDMAKVADRLREIVPEARIVEAHGQMAPTHLEKVMTEFGDGKHDILLATNIVESGLDMPAVNTLIIHRADMFGLAQLYQLRGRVGRGKQRGYAYLTWPPAHRLSAAAQKRLEVMQTLDNLGAGFTLASHDLDIRGAGNLLGDEQSGHIREVGIELYQQMLEDAVADLRAGQGRKKKGEADYARDFTPNINLGLPVLIPEEYVRDLPVRLGLYRRIGALSGEAEIEAMAAELADRFGPVPEEVENLLQVVALKALCRAAGVEKLDAGPKGIVLGFFRNQPRNPGGLVQWVAAQKGLVKLRPDHKLALLKEMELPQRIRVAKELVGAIAKLSGTAKAA
ncbi:transcription-repair coupling factor [Siccirubricoccus sp. KC 17139]|uniref:Transcription-repair-coupling factor n=1 Tax=Siccirubricoccus soli TaxID=2899147 RepID=A0ABT1D497_9PROT|nr:transcription-repair coupling factor [Siccirubricoccus soli]MCO6416751.1 transcription-repair coupling factor [Siccirubricoccus soli]MCP2682886.1 transcription-repair coupling factor [Siccirubricoccus soli]